MSYTVRFHPLVQKDYNEAYYWYEEKQIGLGERFMQMVRLKIAEITAHPNTYGKRTRKLFREAQVDIFPYLIVYRISESSKEVFVASVHHTKKHPKKKYRK
jgi:mRNA-degrading endonuclease RelE of RelBE toxin-antitoxin system